MYFIALRTALLRRALQPRVALLSSQRTEAYVHDNLRQTSLVNPTLITNIQENTSFWYHSQVPSREHKEMPDQQTNPQAIILSQSLTLSIQFAQKNHI
jgi:hypothetical protein